MSGSLENCRRKVRCETSYDAIVAAWRMQFKNPYAKLNAYACKYCDGWHIGNAYNRRDAKKALNRLARMMLHPNFYTKTSLDVQQKLIAKRARMEGFLAYGRDSEHVQKRVDEVMQAMPRWKRRRLIAAIVDSQPPPEFWGTSILPHP